jgi:quercetin dioxygenase-like cupin family protein
MGMFLTDPREEVQNAQHFRVAGFRILRRALSVFGCSSGAICQLNTEGSIGMNRIIAFTGSVGLLFSAALLAQDAMQYRVKHLKVLAEDDKVRVLEYSPKVGDKTPMHSHPSCVVYVLKGGRVKYTMPDGSTRISELKTGDALLRPPVTHADEALDEVDAILIELKK